LSGWGGARAQLIDGGHKDKDAIAARRDQINDRFAKLSSTAAERKKARSQGADQRCCRSIASDSRPVLLRR